MTSCTGLCSLLTSHSTPHPPFFLEFLVLKDYVVLDLENPNFRQNSVSAIGLIVVRENERVDSIYSLINPEDDFEERIIRLTGITPSMVTNSPTLPEFWPKIESLLLDNIVVGHNITYDLRVISKSLKRYSMPVPDFDYCCTLTLSRRNLNLNSYKLENVARSIGVSYKPHNAIEDARASYEVFEYINSRREIPLETVKHYHYTEKLNSKCDARLANNINNLYGIIQVLKYKECLSDGHIALLSGWLEDNHKYNGYVVFNDISRKLKLIITESSLSGVNRYELSKCVHFISDSSAYKKKTLKIQVLQGIIKAVTCDDAVSMEELLYLNQWLEKNSTLQGDYVYDRIQLLTKQALEDNILLDQQQKQLAQKYKEILKPTKYHKGEIQLKDKTYTLTGNFKHITRDQLRKKLAKQHLTEKTSVSTKVDYLIIGTIPSPGWKYGNTGTKIIKAQEIQEKGGKIELIKEEDLLKQLGYKI